MRKTSLIALLIVGWLIAAGCGGGGSKKTIDVGDGNKVSLANHLPDSFPSDFPIYKGADLQGAVEGEQEGIKGVVATWTSGDSVDDVKAYYDGAFRAGQWTTTAKGSASGSSFWSVENKTTGKVGYIAVNPGDKVTIIGTVGDNPDKSRSTSTSDGSSDGASDGTDTSTSAAGTDGASDATLPEAVQIPADFPKATLPVPNGARVTNTSSIAAGQSKSYTLVFYSKDTSESLGRYYKDTFEGKGYTQSVQTSDGSGLYAAYSEKTDGTGAVIQLTVAESDVKGYREATLQLVQQ